VGTTSSELGERVPVSNRFKPLCVLGKDNIKSVPRVENATKIAIISSNPRGLFGLELGSDMMISPQLLELILFKVLNSDRLEFLFTCETKLNDRL
jgi:hypothetical protein